MAHSLVAIAAILAVMAVATPVPRLIVIDDTTSLPVICRSLDRDEQVILAFTHSMFGGDVREVYTVTDRGTLRRLAMLTEHPAAADYYAHTADVIREGDMYRIDLPAAEFEEIAVRIDRVGHPRLIFHDRELDLLAATGNQHRIIIGAELGSRFAADTC